MVSAGFFPESGVLVCKVALTPFLWAGTGWGLVCDHLRIGSPWPCVLVSSVSVACFVF